MASSGTPHLAARHIPLLSEHDISSYPSRRSPRLRDYDYAQPGAYFVTLCAHFHACLFGAITDDAMQQSVAGAMVASVWEGLPDHYAGIELDAWMLMPNHLHGIVVLLDPTPHGGGLTLSQLIGRYKSFTTYQYRRIGTVPTMGARPLWQRSFHERVIRNERELDAVRAYIVNNLVKWHLDREMASAADDARRSTP